MDDGTFDMVVETPAGSQNKYEWDAEAGMLRLDRRLSAAVSFPADYGFIPGTRTSDGEALDAVVLLAAPSIPGCILRARAVGVLWLAFGVREEPKIVSVLDGDGRFDGIDELEELPAAMRAELEHFFLVYQLADRDTTPARAVRMGNLAEAIGTIASARAAVD